MQQNIKRSYDMAENICIQSITDKVLQFKKPENFRLTTINDSSKASPLITLAEINTGCKRVNRNLQTKPKVTIQTAISSSPIRFFDQMNSRRKSGLPDIQIVNFKVGSPKGKKLNRFSLLIKQSAVKLTAIEKFEKVKRIKEEGWLNNKNYLDSIFKEKVSKEKPRHRTYKNKSNEIMSDTIVGRKRFESEERHNMHVQ